MDKIEIYKKLLTTQKEISDAQKERKTSLILKKAECKDESKLKIQKDKLIEELKNISSELRSDPKVSLYQKLTKKHSDCEKKLLEIEKQMNLRDSLKSSNESEGWKVEKEYKTSIWFSKLKSHDIAFEDKVWYMFSVLGFKVLNSDRNFAIPYDKKGGTQQIDVFAKEDGTVLYVECKSKEEASTTVSNFKEPLEAWKEKKEGLEKNITKLFEGEKLKKKFLFVTNKIKVGEKDTERIKDLGAIHLDERRVDYFLALYQQLGSAARYQFLSFIFEGYEIPGLDNKIPAIRGKMGGYTYYTFNIEPEKLLRIAYVLHRNKAHENMMPTYQRLIKRSRLTKIKQFVKDQGFFPNSLLISIDSKTKKGYKDLRFDPSELQVADSISKIGVLHLPNKFASAYIIDGQHRLYAYSDVEYSQTNTIPVVAFVNLAKEEQINLFMQINENQKAIPKSLRVTLNADLLWTSDNLKNQFEALWGKISIALGEDFDSIFYDYITTGEDNRTLTPRGAFYLGLNKGSRKLIGKVNKTEVEEYGVFYNGNIENTYNLLVKLFKNVFEYLTTNLPKEWNLKGDSLLFVNKGVAAIIMLLGDIYHHNIENKKIKYKVKKDLINEGNFEIIKEYLDHVIRYVKTIPADKKQILKLEKGDRGPIKYWRYFQQAISDEVSSFKPEGLKEYMEEESLNLNGEAADICLRIETILCKYSQYLLEKRFTEEWAWKKGVPEDVQTKAQILMINKNRTEKKEDETNEWQNLNLIHHAKIAKTNWKYKHKEKQFDLFSSLMTMDFEEHKSNVGKEAALKWLDTINKIRNKSAHIGQPVLPDELDFAKKVLDQLTKKTESIEDLEIFQKE